MAYANDQLNETGATPCAIEVAIWYYCRCEPHPRLHAGAVREAVNGLVEHGLMVERPACDSGYYFTEKGRAWIQMLCTTPLPVNIYVDPRTNKKTD
jgi:hypothetical protein